LWKVPRLHTFVLLGATCEWAVGGMILTGERRSIRRKTCHIASSSTKNVHDLNWDRTRAFAVKRPATFSVGGEVLQFVPPQRTQCTSIRKTNQFILHGGKVTIYCNNHSEHCHYICYTVIPRLTKIISSGVTFVSRNVFISAPGMARPFMFAALC